MRIEIVDEARDEADAYPVLELKREREAIAIITPSLSIFIGPAEEFLEQAIDLLEPPVINAKGS